MKEGSMNQDTNDMDKTNLKIQQHGIARSSDIQKIVDALDTIIGSFGSMSQEEYDAIETYDERMYFVKSDRGRLTRVYYGATLIARSKREGETIVLGFPCDIPVLF